MPAERVYSVSEITRQIKASLEEGFPWVTVQGEISNFRPSGAGHWYFTLKDPEAVLSVVMFRGRLEAVRFTPADGALVRATGSISVYGRRGAYQLVCESLVKAGEGDLLARMEEMKRRLAAEGLFDPARKKALPLFPSRIVVVTSPTGAAVRDILRVLRRRSAGIDVVIVPTLVQGDGAEEQIAHAIETADRLRLGDVMIVGRGGGSLEDLAPFSSEAVVRAIAACSLPVISAVGHETDVALSDLAADLRAPTPSAAAEMVTATRADLLGRVRGARELMVDVMRQRVQRVRLLMGQFTADNLGRNLRWFLQPLAQRLDEARDGVGRSLRERLTASRHRLALTSRELASYSPLEVLARGYAVVTHLPTGRVLLSPEPASPGDGLSIRLARGAIRAAVEVTDAGKG